MGGMTPPLPLLKSPAALEDALAGGHPWLYRDRLGAQPRLEDGRMQDGAWVRVEAGRFQGVGLWAERGAIALRLFRRGTVGDALAAPDRPWIQGMVRRALAQRSSVAEAGSDAYRLLYGEGDGLPGLTVDRYGRFAVIKTYADGYRLPGSDAHRLLIETARSLAAELGLRGVLLAPHGEQGLQALHGQEPPPELSVHEHDLVFLANLHHGQKTGLFLDHRENRATVRGLAAGRRVANLFSYTGAFSVHALAGGAQHALDVDTAADALRDAERNVVANRTLIEAAAPGSPAQERHATLRLDLLSDPAAALRDAAFDGRDLIVLDPPSLARHKGQRHAALRAYRRLNAAAMRTLPDGGLLATASCTAQVSPEAFREALAEAAAEAEVEARVLHEAGHAADHPVPLAFPEGRYLKFMVLRVDRPL